MKVHWSLRVLLAVVIFAVSSHGTIEIVNRIRLITPDDDIGGGRVEVYHDDQWGTVCDENWDDKAAEVVCKELGYSGAISAIKKAHFGRGTGPIHLSNVVCDGSEHSILECKNDGWGVTGSCAHKDDAGVRCIKTDIPELEYLGCWIDNPLGQRILPDFYSNRRGKGLDWHNLGETVLKCGSDAINSGKDYKLFAVQFYGECYSTPNNTEDYKKMRAAPNACVFGVGELSHNAVYGFGNYSNLGCWKDKPGERTMTLLKNFRGTGFIDWFDMSKMVKACYKEAKDAGKTFFAMQFYGECWASDDGKKFKDHGQATNCYNGVGTQWSNYVYKIHV